MESRTHNGNIRPGKYFRLYLVLVLVSVFTFLLLCMLRKNGFESLLNHNARFQSHGTMLVQDHRLPWNRTGGKSYTLQSYEAIPSTNESAFNRVGYANMTIMERQRTPREDISLMKLPSRVRCTDSFYDKPALWSMIVCVKSHVKNVARRNLIRTTWGAMKNSFGVRLSVIFAVGVDAKVDDRLIALEQQQYGDLIQTNLTEEYRSVGMKVLSGMQWVKQNCQNHWIYASADDDMLPDLRNVYLDVQKEMYNGFENIPIICHFRLHYIIEGPIRSKSYKNHVPKELYSMDKYPKFCSGGFYSMPVSLANGILEISRYHTYFYNDDVWFTALLRLSAIDAGLIHSHMISNEDSAISKFKGGSVKHEYGNEANLRKDLFQMYPPTIS